MKNYSNLKLDDAYLKNHLLEVKEKLEKKGFSVVVMNDASKIRKFIEDFIPDEALVGLDGSSIIEDLDIPLYLRNNWNVIIDPFQKDLAPEIRKYLADKLPSTEYFITSPVGLTNNGTIVFNKNNSFLVNGNIEKPENVIAFINYSNILKNEGEINLKINEEHFIMEVCPFGLNKNIIDNYGQIEEIEEKASKFKYRQNTFTIVLLIEELVY